MKLYMNNDKTSIRLPVELKGAYFPVWRADNNRMKGNTHCNIFTRQRLNNNY